jgi:hypothetical protein
MLSDGIKHGGPSPQEAVLLRQQDKEHAAVVKEKIAKAKKAAAENERLEEMRKEFGVDWEEGATTQPGSPTSPGSGKRRSKESSVPLSPEALEIIAIKEQLKKELEAAGALYAETMGSAAASVDGSGGGSKGGKGGKKKLESDVILHEEEVPLVIPKVATSEDAAFGLDGFDDEDAEEDDVNSLFCNGDGGSLDGGSVASSVKLEGKQVVEVVRLAARRRLRDDDWAVRLLAVQALEDALGPVEPLPEDEHDEEELRHYFGKGGGQHAPPQRHHHRHHSSSHKNSKAAAAGGGSSNKHNTDLGGEGEVRIAPDGGWRLRCLLWMAHHETVPECQVAALEALAKGSWETCAEYQRGFLPRAATLLASHKDPRVRAASAMFVGKVGRGLWDTFSKVKE